MEVWFIVNPRAGNGRAGRVWSNLVNRLPPGVDCEVRVSNRPRETAERAREAARRGVDRVVAVGGDGTVNLVGSQLVDTDSSLAHLPLGTSNDWARTLLGSLRPEAALEQVFRGRIKRWDVGLLNDRRYVLNVAGAGFDGHVVHAMNRWRPPPFLPGRLAWLACVGFCLPKLREYPVTLRIDDRNLECTDFQLLAAGIGSYYAGGMPIFPRADPADGQFEIAWVRGRSRTQLVRLLPRIYQGRHLKRPGLHYLRGRRITLDSPGSLPAQVDGEEAGTAPLTLRLLPRALRVVTPR